MSLTPDEIKAIAEALRQGLKEDGWTPPSTSSTTSVSQARTTEGSLVDAGLFTASELMVARAKLALRQLGP